jgi:hypothetical protein
MSDFENLPDDDHVNDDVDFDDLPGMERDEVDTPDEADLDEWSEAELDEWYDSLPPDTKLALPTTQEGWELRFAVHTALEGMGLVPSLEDETNDEVVQAFFSGPPNTWKRFGPDLKAQYRRYVEPLTNDGSRPPPSKGKSGARVYIGGGLLMLVLLALFFAWLRDGDDSKKQATAPTTVATELAPATTERTPTPAAESDTEVVLGFDESPPTPTTTADEPDEELESVDECDGIEGCDAEGDVASSSNVASAGNPLATGVDIASIGHRSPDAATQIFTIELFGAGQNLAGDPDSQFYQISIRVDGELATWPEAGFDVTASYTDGVPDAGAVPLWRSLDEEGQPTATRMAGAEVTFEWEENNKFVLTVINHDEDVSVTTFVVSTVGTVFTDDAYFPFP